MQSSELGQDTLNEEKNVGITVVGLFIVLFLGLFYVGFSYPLTEYSAVGKSMVLGFSLQLLCWRLTSYFKSYFYAPLITVGLLWVLSFIPGGGLILTAGTLYLFYKFFPLARRFLKKWPLLTQIFGFIGIGFIYAFYIFASTNKDIGDHFVTEKLRQFTLNPDTLFFASFATMFKNYGEIATGLNGFHRVHYHVLSHITYARIAKLMSMEVLQVFGYVNLIAIGSMLVTGLLRAIGDFTKLHRYSFFLLNLIVLGGPLSLVFNFMGDSHFVSESYLFALVLLTGPLALATRVLNGGEMSWPEKFVLGLYIFGITTAKISVGILFWGAFSLASVVKAKFNLLKVGPSLLIWSIGAVLGYLCVRTQAIQGLEVVFYWKWYQEKARNEPSLLWFLATHFMYIWVLSFSLFQVIRKKKFERLHLLWSLVIFSSAAVGFVALNITIDSSGYYFSNVHLFLSLPLFAYLLSQDWIEPSQPFSLRQHLLNFRTLPAIFLGLSCLYFMGVIIPTQYRQVFRNRKAVLKNSDYISHYAPLFEKIKNDPDPKMMVYIPKTESEFWLNPDDKISPWRDMRCIKMPFFIPIATGKPGLFALPTINEHCKVFFRGFESYSDAEYVESARLNHSPEELCQKVKSIGFHGYYHVTRQNGAEKISCTDI